MKTIEQSYMDVTTNLNFNSDTRFDINFCDNVQNLLYSIEDNLPYSRDGYSLHAALLLSSEFEENGIYSEILFTPELIPYKGKSIQFDRFSVLYYDKNDKRYYVANPIEDIKLFTLLGLDSSLRYSRYDKNCSLRISKDILDDVTSQNALRIQFDDYVINYGDGICWSLGNVFENFDHSFENLKRSAISISKKQYIKKLI